MLFTSRGFTFVPLVFGESSLAKLLTYGKYVGRMECMSETDLEAEHEAAFQFFMDQSHNSKVPDSVWGDLKEVITQIASEDPHDDAADISEAVSLATGITFINKPEACAALYYLGARAAAKTYETALAQNQEVSDNLMKIGEGLDTAEIRGIIESNEQRIPQVKKFARNAWNMLNNMPPAVVTRVSTKVEEHYANQKTH